MDNLGFVKLPRKYMDSPMFQNEKLWKVWTWCLMKANHQHAWVPFKIGKGTTQVTVKPGQFICGRKSASKELNMKQSTQRNQMLKLKILGFLEIKTYSHYSIVTILNWEDDQAVSRTSSHFEESAPKKDTQHDLKKNNQYPEIIPVNADTKHDANKILTANMTSERTTRGQPKDTNKNEKNEKERIYICKRNSRESMFLEDGVKEVLDYLNEFRGELLNRKDLKPITTDMTIITRLKEGKTVFQCCQIIWTKSRDEHFKENPKYFHPDTLFRPKHWQKYLDEFELLMKQGSGQ